MELLKDIFTYLWIIGSILLLISILQFIYILFNFLWKKWKLYKILYENLSKKVYFVLPNNTNEYKMENEIKSIDNNIFTIDFSCTSYNNFKLTKDVWLVVVWYKKWCVDIETFKFLLDEIWKHTPIIFYTYWDNQAFDFRENSLDDFSSYLKRYDNYLIDNFPLKLIWDIFSIISIYKK